MKIDHIALYTCDLERSRAFYQDYFGGVSNTQYHNPQTGLRTYFLTLDGDTRLELMSRPELENTKPSQLRTGWVHLAFSTGGEDQVDALTERLRKDGYEVVSGPRRTGDGYYESCVLDPDGNMVEITA